MNEEFELLDASDPKKNKISKVQVEVPLKQLMLFESPQILQMKEEITKTDPSFIVSSLTILNNSPTYFGRNKYI